jgi:hypothetical protein
MRLSQLTSRKWAVMKPRGWSQGKQLARIANSFIAQGRLYNVKKHSARSKYRGYYIVELKGSLLSREFKVAKNLTKKQAVAWIKLLKGL